MVEYTNNPFETQTAQDAIREASEALGETVACEFRDFVRGMSRFAHSESPIEAVFWVWWKVIAWADQEVRHNVRDFDLLPQFEVTADGSRYRLDFAIEDLQIAVELDGHDFHERTPEQVTYRNVRDRKLQAAGWTVLHISGTELLRGPRATVEGIYDLCITRERAATAHPVASEPDEVVF